mgnify:CR=1 FL=1
MKKVLLYFVVFIVVYLTFLVATVPAQLVLGQVTLPKNVNVSGVSGTIWQSQFKQISHDKIQLNKVRADLSAWSLFSLTPTVDINFGDPVQHGPVGELTLIVLDNELRVEDAKISLAANDIIKNANLEDAMIGNHVKYDGKFKSISIGDFDVTLVVAFQSLLSLDAALNFN